VLLLLLLLVLVLVVEELAASSAMQGLAELQSISRTATATNNSYHAYHISSWPADSIKCFVPVCWSV
jgi:hypothetical protein